MAMSANNRAQIHIEDKQSEIGPVAHPTVSPAVSATSPVRFAWKETKTNLRYCVSDYSLFSIRIPGWTYEVPLAPLLPATFEADIKAFLKSAPSDVPLLCVRNLPIDKPMPRLQSADRRLQYTLNQCYQYYVDLSGSFDDYLTSLSGRTRSTLKRKVKKFASLDGDKIDWRKYSRPEQMSEYHSLARQVARKTYQERLFHGALPAHENFKSELSSLAAADRLRAYLLFSNNTPIAYLHLPVHDGVVEYAYLGYDPVYSALSPGSVLLYSALNDLFSEQRFSYFDFSYGAGQTKEVFCTARYLRADVFYLAGSMKHYVAAYAHMALDSASALIGRALERTNLHTTVKRVLRRGGAAA